MDDEFKTLEKYIEESKGKFEFRRQLRLSNQQDNIRYPDEATLAKLDSSIKKNSAFVKKLKVFTESQKELILAELDKLNLTKFISEIASSIIEAKLKLNDIPAVIEICSKLNKSYKDFSKNLLEQYSKYFPTINKRKQNDQNATGQHGSPSSSSSSVFIQSTSSNTPISSSAGGGGPHHQTSILVSNKGVLIRSDTTQISVNSSKIRVDLRLFAEFVICGVFPLKDGFPVLMNLLCYIMVYDRVNQQNLNAILTFCRGCGDELLGLVPKDIQISADRFNMKLPSSDLLPLKRQELLRMYVNDYYLLILKHLNNLHEELNELITKNKKIYKSKGEINKDTKELTEIKQAEYQKIYNLLSQLAELLNLHVPILPDLDDSRDQNFNDSKGKEIEIKLESESKTNSIWDDEGTRNFYEGLSNLKALFPNLTIKIAVNKNSNLKNPNENLDTVDGDGSGSTNDSSTPVDAGGDDADSSSEDDSSNTGGEPSSQQASGPLIMTQAVANRVQPDQYYAKLSNCVNRDMIDNAAIDFIRFFNTKFGRRKIVKTLFNVQRTRLDLLPFFARFTATLYPYVPSIGNELVALLRQDFRNLFKKKDQINIESKVKNVRFIGELVKFGIYSRQEALNCLKILLSDFTHHHIEMTCNLLETCGRLLYKSSDSHHQLRLLLEQMMRKKLLLSVDSKYITMIENAYYFTNPPEIVKHVVEEPAVRVYVRYLLYERLNRSTIDLVLQKLKKLDWSDITLTKFVINCMIEAYNIKFYNIRYLAALLAAVNKEHHWISVSVIDGVVEDILLMMEINEQQFNQRRIPMIRYFGELYNYRLSDSSLVFKILYSLITYGVYYPEPEQTLIQIPMSRLDPPDNLFRIKLVCDLLETCGQYLSNGQERKKLDCYLLFFQRYYWHKKHVYMLHPYCLAKTSNQFPASIEYLYNDAIYNLRPAFQMATSYSQAIQSVQNFIDNLIVVNENDQVSSPTVVN